MYFFLTLSAISMSLLISPESGADALNPKKLVIITDIEPDDRVAFHIFGAYLDWNEIGLVGTALLNSGRKAVLAERSFRDLGFLRVPVLRGTGGSGADYRDIHGTRLARNYEDEGKGILSPERLEELSTALTDGQPFRTALRDYLRENRDVEIALKTAPTDLMAVLTEEPALVENIKVIHVMGGWTEAEEGTLRTSYNHNMDPEASKALYELGDRVHIRVYSSHMLKNQFQGGSISRKNMPGVLMALESAKASLRSLIDLERAGRSWDEALIESIPGLAERIGLENMGRQFTPADPAMVMSIFEAERLETSVRRVSINLDLDDLDPGIGFRVRVNDDPNSKIELVEEINVEFFKEALEGVFRSLTERTNQRLRRYRRLQTPLDMAAIRSKIEQIEGRGVHVQSIGRNIGYIRSRLSKLDPFSDFLIVDLAAENATEFAKLARREGFQVIGITTIRNMPYMEEFCHYDEIFILEDRPTNVGAIDPPLPTRNLGMPAIRLDRDITPEIYISFHTKDGQSLDDIALRLEQIARLHPTATVIHGFLPRSQIHFLPEGLRETVTRTLDLLDRFFPGRHTHYRNRYVGIGDVRREMGERAYRTHVEKEARLYAIGSIAHGVAEEVKIFSRAGVPVFHVPLASGRESLIHITGPDGPITCEMALMD